MSQRIIYEILKELGGTATNKQIIKRTQELYPDSSLSLNVSSKLRRLAKWGIVKMNPKDRSYTIIGEYYD